MLIEQFLATLRELTGDDMFFTGVPDSLLRPLCDYLVNTYGTDGPNHVVAANEGNAVGIAAGYHLATGKIPVVYMQNSGEGNVVNPAASLLNERVYGVPVFFVVGWRGEPGVHDEPQHIYQGEITVRLLEDLEIEPMILEKETSQDRLREFVKRARLRAEEGRSSAVVVRKGALEYSAKAQYSNDRTMIREEIVRCVVQAAGDDPIVSTTGKISRELFEIREARGEGHERDFLTVGSMGHSSSVALGIAMQKPQTKIWCLDGDGAVLMHMGAMAVIGARRPSNFVHVVLNNGAHESVGGMPTAAGTTDLCKVAEGCGYERIFRADDYETLRVALSEAKKSRGLAFIEATCALASRADLGRPTTTAQENKQKFMQHLQDKR